MSDTMLQQINDAIFKRLQHQHERVDNLINYLR